MGLLGMHRSSPDRIVEVERVTSAKAQELDLENSIRKQLCGEHRADRK